MLLSVVLIVAAIVIAFGLGLALGLYLKGRQTSSLTELASQILKKSEVELQTQVDAVKSEMRASFGSMSLDVLNSSTEQFLKVADSKFQTERQDHAKELDSKKQLIDEKLGALAAELEKMRTLTGELEKDRYQKFGELTKQLAQVNDQTNDLRKTTAALREALASSKVRGQWGERMAEDVLRAAGFLEGINYTKQKAIEQSGTKPDFTFLLPSKRCLNMDVKFPFDNFLRYVEAENDTDKERFRKDFLRDVKARAKEITTREYISPDQNTVDYVLLFIPSEQMYAFIHEQDHTVLDEGLKNHVVFCSPLTLFAILAVVRQAVENFALEQTSNEILSLLGSFHKQWDQFIQKMGKMGERIADAQREYEAMTTTRRRQLERPLNRLDEIRRQKGLPLGDDGQLGIEGPVESDDRPMA